MFACHVRTNLIACRLSGKCVWASMLPYKPLDSYELRLQCLYEHFEVSEFWWIGLSMEGQIFSKINKTLMGFKGAWWQNFVFVFFGQTIPSEGFSHLWWNIWSRFSSSFLSSSRSFLHCASPAGSGAGVSSYGLSSLPPSPQPGSSQASSALPSPGAASSIPEPQLWAHDLEPSAKRPAVPSAPSPAALQDTSSQDTQSSGESHFILFHVCNVIRA